MKIHKITVIVIDHDQLGADEACAVLETASYPNRCIRPRIWTVQTRDCGEWSDDHPINMKATSDAAIAELFERLS